MTPPISKKASQEHRRLVLNLIRFFQEQNLVVTHADRLATVEYDPPEQIRGCIPDVVAKADTNVLTYGEAETQDTLTSNPTHVEKQIKAFTWEVRRGKYRVRPELYLIVPSTCYSHLESILNRCTKIKTELSPTKPGSDSIVKAQHIL